MECLLQHFLSVLDNTGRAKMPFLWIFLFKYIPWCITTFSNIGHPHPVKPQTFTKITTRSPHAYNMNNVYKFTHNFAKTFCDDSTWSASRYVLSFYLSLLAEWGNQSAEIDATLGDANFPPLPNTLPSPKWHFI